jgi:hypothetical protein
MFDAASVLGLGLGSYGVGPATGVLLVSPVWAWTVLLGFLVVSSGALFLLTEYESGKPWREDETSRFRKAA